MSDRYVYIKTWNLEKGNPPHRHFISYRVIQSKANSEYLVLKHAKLEGHAEEFEYVESGGYTNFKAAEDFILDKITGKSLTDGFTIASIVKHGKLSEEVMMFYKKKFLAERIKITKVHKAELVEYINETGTIYSVYQDMNHDVRIAVNLDNFSNGVDLYLGKDSFVSIP